MLETQAQPITKDQINALRKADTVSLNFMRNLSDTRQPYHSYIRAVIKHKVNGFQSELESEEIIIIPANDKIRTYKQVDSNHVKSCHASNLFGSFPDWQGIAHFLRAGDILEIDWYVGGGNGYVEKSRYTDKDHYASEEPIYHDYVKLTVLRGKNRKRYSFKFADSICPNNTARMAKIENW